MDRPWVPMPGVSWRVVVRVHPARVPDVVCMHALCPRLHCSTLIARPSRLSVISRASVDGLNVDQMAPLRLAPTLRSLSSRGKPSRQARHYGRVRDDSRRPPRDRYECLRLVRMAQEYYFPWRPEW